MKRRKKIILWVWIGLVIGMVLFPPILKNKYSSGHYRRQAVLEQLGGEATFTPQELIPGGYRFIFDMGSGRINAGILTTQLIIVTLVMGGMFFTIKDE